MWWFAEPGRFVRACLAFGLGVWVRILAAELPALDFSIELETVLRHDDGQFLWFHPRPTATPEGAILTLQKHLKVSDYYSGLHVLRRTGLDGPWSSPTLPPALDWRPQPDGVTVSVADATPGYHAPSRQVIAIGCQVRYSPAGRQLEDVRRAHQTVYSVLDPKGKHWTPWSILELPESPEFDFARNACSQWLVLPDGSLLVPLYIARNAAGPYSTTVAHCRLEGQRLRYLRHGSILRLETPRGLYEPSLIAHAGRFHLTLRNDVRAYHAVSEDGLNFGAVKPWTFDDGTELGSYNTQQHWLGHRAGFFLVYTRRAGTNDHIIRHRAPLFIARVDPRTGHLLRRTERIVIPERGAELGNFGAAAMSPTESWVTVSEGMFMKDSRARGAEGGTFVARIRWSVPNQDFPQFSKNPEK
jgi:hypothetical protein